MPEDRRADDLAGRDFWEGIWRAAGGRRFNPLSYYDYRFAAYFERWVPRGGRLLEAGCGASSWLPYFARRLGCSVWGVDYSETGVALARANLAREGVSGTIIQADAFDCPELPKSHFDALWSGGFIEHFQETSQAISKLASHLKPGAVMVTSIPNLHGFVGWLHKAADPAVYAAHVPLSPKELDAAHLRAGLEVACPARYFGVFSLGVVNFNRLRSRLPGFLDRVLWLGLLAVQQAVCLPFRVLGRGWESRTFSPYVLGTYRRRGEP